MSIRRQFTFDEASPHDRTQRWWARADGRLLAFHRREANDERTERIARRRLHSVTKTRGVQCPICVARLFDRVATNSMARRGRRPSSSFLFVNFDRRAVTQFGQRVFIGDGRRGKKLWTFRLRMSEMTPALPSQIGDRMPEFTPILARFSISSLPGSKRRRESCWPDDVSFSVVTGSSRKLRSCDALELVGAVEQLHVAVLNGDVTQMVDVGQTLRE